MKKNKVTNTTSPVSLISFSNRKSPISEQYRSLRTSIQFSSTAENPIQTMVVTSSGPSEGKSTTSANLAIVFAATGKRVLLVDTDMRKPTVWKTFGLSNRIGLSSLLIGMGRIEDAASTTQVEGLTVLTSGPTPPNPSELLESARMNEIIQEAKAKYDIVIFDMPPIITVTDAQIMSAKVDGTVLVIREEISNKSAVKSAKELLDAAKANILGVVYNSTNATSKEHGYYYYYGEK